MTASILANGTDMIKKLIGAGVGLAVLIVGYSAASWWSGMRIQSRSYAAVDAINIHLARTLSDQIRVTLRDYDRGVFSSQSSYALTFPQKAGDETAQKREILFLNQIDHGPFPLKNIGSGHFKPIGALIETSVTSTPWTEGLFKATQGRSFINGKTRVSTDGVANLKWAALPFDLRHDALRTQFGGAQLNAEISPRFHNRKGELSIESLNLTDGRATIDIKSAKLQTDTRRGPAGISIGVNSREVGSLTWSSIQAPTIDLQKLSVRSELKLQGSDVGGETNIDITELSVAQNKLGAFRLTAYYDQLDDHALEPLLELYNRVLTRTAANILAPEPLSAVEVKKLWVHLHGLLKNNLAVRLEPLVWETPLGKSQFSLNLDLKPAELASGGVGLRESPIETLDATLTVSQPMIEGLIVQKFQTPGTPAAKVKSLADREIKKLTDTAVQLKLGRPQGGKLVAHFNVQDAELRINGQRTPAEPLLKLLGTLTSPNWFNNRTPAGQQGPDESATIQHLDPEVMSDILSRSNFTYEESRDADGDLVLKVAPSDSGADKIEIVFIGCRKDPTCEDVLLRATYSPDRGAALKFVNDWNLRNRWGRAFINESKAPVLEMDISAYGGIGQDAIESMVSTFFKLVRDFAKESKAAETAKETKTEQAPRSPASEETPAEGTSTQRPSLN